MSNGFEGYGEQEIITCYCEEISFAEIERRAMHRLENFKHSDKVYLSNDLYADLIKQMAHSFRAGTKSPMHIMKVNTSAGCLDVIRAPLLCNFCLVGTEDDYNLVERAKIDKAFEEIVFDGKSDVCGRSTPEDNQLPVGSEVSSVVKPTNN